MWQGGEGSKLLGKIPLFDEAIIDEEGEVCPYTEGKPFEGACRRKRAVSVASRIRLVTEGLPLAICFVIAEGALEGHSLGALTYSPTISIVGFGANLEIYCEGRKVMDILAIDVTVKENLSISL